MVAIAVWPAHNVAGSARNARCSSLGVPCSARQSSIATTAAFNFLADAGAFVLLALGLNIVVGFAGLLDLGYAAFFAIGSYSFAMLASPQFNAPSSVLGAAVRGVGDRGDLRHPAGRADAAPARRLPGDRHAGVRRDRAADVFQYLSQWTGGPNGIGSLDQPTIGSYKFGFDPLPYYYVVLALIALAVWLANNLRDSRLGRAWMAIREDELAAAHMGINTTATKLAAFALGASFSGLAGCALASKLQLVSTEQFQFQVSVFILAMLVLGGMGNIPGVIVGALVLVLVNNVVLPQANTIAASAGLHVDFGNYHFFIYGAILVAIMLFKPEGLLPSRQRKEELHHAAT